MGVPGAVKYFCSQSMVSGFPNASDRQHRKWDNVLRPAHLIFDMNSVIHSAFDSSQTSLTSWIASLKAFIATLMSYVTPTKTIFVACDGVAPLAKLLHQRQRRKRLSVSNDFLTDDAVATRKMNNVVGQEITAGSPLLAVMEEEIVSWLLDYQVEHLPHVSLFSSPSNESGEGEIKISCFIRRWCGENPTACSDSFTIIGNDSDLVFVGLLATLVQEVHVIHPTTLDITSISPLLRHWALTVPNPPLHPDLLKSYRIDFTYIMLLSGSDYYNGVGPNVRYIWKEYRRLRANGGFYTNSLIRYADDFDVDTHFLRTILENASRNVQHGSKSHNLKIDPAQGESLLCSAMWVLQTMVDGSCINPNYFSVLGNNKAGRSVSIQSLSEAAKKRGIARKIIEVTRVPEWLVSEFCSDLTDPVCHYLLSPFEQYIAVMGLRGRYSAEVKAKIIMLDDRGAALTSSESIKAILHSILDLRKRINVNRLLPCEQKLMIISQPPADSMRNLFMQFSVIREPEKMEELVEKTE